MIIALASPCVASTLDEGLDKIKRLMSEASARGVEIVCFPEAYLPGLRDRVLKLLPFDQTQQERALRAVAQWARTYKVATILGMKRAHDDRHDRSGCSDLTALLIPTRLATFNSFGFDHTIWTILLRSLILAALVNAPSRGLLFILNRGAVQCGRWADRRLTVVLLDHDL